MKSRTQALYSAAVHNIVGNGQTTLFWSVHRLHGTSVCELAPNLFSLIFETSTMVQGKQ